MTLTRQAPRRGFTLIELLVAMAVIVVLATIALVVVPDVMNKDRTTDAAGSVRQWLSLAKARAVRDQEPRGVRFLVGTDSNNPAKTNPLWVTELQYTEARTILTLDASKTAFRNVYATFNCSYDAAGAMTISPPPWSASSSPQCVISNLTYEDALQIIPGSLLTISNLGTGTSHRVLYVPSAPQKVTTPPTNGSYPVVNSYTLTVILDSYPQSELGAAGQAGAPLLPVFTTTLFGITAPPQPLVGEPTLQLPKNTCVDLASSMSGSSLLNSVPSPPFIDILFLPSGQVQPTFSVTGVGAAQKIQSIGASNQIFLWVRDYTKIPSSASNPQQNALNVLSPGPPVVFDQVPFNQGGEQQIVSIKTKSGALGMFPILWPQGDGTYAPGQDPYTFARQGATAP